MPYQRFGYAPSGDLVATHTYTNAMDAVSEFYAYDVLGNRIATTDALGNTVYKAFDPFGNLISEWGATYPVRYTYDTQNRRTSLSTTRDGDTWDVTRWIYDTATGLCTSKIYADGSTVAYTYTPDGLSLRTTYASGRWTENVYNERREVIETLSSDNADNVSYVKDEFGRIVSEANSVATVTYSLTSSGIATNELWTLGNHTATVARSLDRCGRILFNNGMHFAYSEDGKLKGLSNGLAKVEYLYSLDRLDVGYKIELPNGRIFTRNSVRDSFRRGLMVNVASSVNGSKVDNIAYVYDALGRPVHRNSDSFSYNGRSEVIGATVSGVASVYGYDEIGNSSLFEVNNVNQYSQFQHDLDGNLLFDGNLSFAYDSNNRLKTVSSNGVLLVTNFYDARSRRVKKVTADATITFFYDDWNLIEERIAYTNGTTSTIKYYWGTDISGMLQGAGGIGGLLYQTIDGVIYLPSCDNNGNILKYVDENGNIVASYTYNAFGALIAKSGPRADVFRHRFSTKYFDVETGLYYYGYRFYHPALMRWLNRDPIEEDGGVNLYGFCGNNGVVKYDKFGLAHFEVRKLSAAPGIIPYSCFGAIIGLGPAVALDLGLANKWNIEILHEHLFYDDGTNVGYGEDREFVETSKKGYYRRDPTEYDDCIMKEAQKRVPKPPYSLIGWGSAKKYNCQDYADSLRNEYSKLVNDKEVRCKCKKVKK